MTKKKKYRLKHLKIPINFKIIRITMFIVCLLMMMYSTFRVSLWFISNKKTSDNIDEIKEDTELDFQEDDSNTQLVGKDEKNDDYWYFVSLPLMNVNINELKSRNSDTVGFINVNNTNINYPFVQYIDNEFYLNHSFDKSKNEAGWVFLDYRNDKNLADKNNIIYAHSRLDKTMFGSLSKVFKKKWYTNRDNHIIRISTETENSMWQIFSVYKIPTESYYITTSFATDEAYNTFLDTIKSRSIYNFDVTLTSEDRILTLSTCYSEKEKTVVHAKLIKKTSK